MRQRITIEELNELTDEQKVRLKEWWKPHFGDFFIWFGQSDQEDIVLGHEYTHEKCARINSLQEGLRLEFNDCLPLLSIGQCIEILQSSNTDWTPNGSDWDEPDIIEVLWNKIKKVFQPTP
jgi:hypothetical protein